MAIYKCKMCGGDLDVAENATVAVCDYCGSKQTVPTARDEELSNLFNRANLLRRKCEFDKAEQLYEKILVKDDKQSEAYWGVLLCRYGIEYVEDPATSNRIPTCHRTSFEAITSDEYYKSALECADSVQRKIYEQEAKYIDGIQKDILALSQKEDPYDVFICYKENDNGKRTQDSAIANDIYYQLTNEGFKVFYAAITLESHLGTAYEPYIFAALNSAKVMLAIGTKPEYFNAVWVKNEWSRYLKMMKNDKSKQLIPCYRDMDAYELPEEFAHLQAQDMSKIGFISDIVRGIKKIVRKDDPKTESRSSDVGGSTSLRNLMKRAYLDLESRNFDSARAQFDKMQDIDPENGEVYLIGLLCDLKFSRPEELEECSAAFTYNNNWRNLNKFADPTLKARMDELLQLNENWKTYCAVKRNFDLLSDDAVYEDAKNKLASLGDYRDSKTLLESLTDTRDEAIANRIHKIIGQETDAALRETEYQTLLRDKKLNDTHVQLHGTPSVWWNDEKEARLSELQKLVEEDRRLAKENDPIANSKVVKELLAKIANEEVRARCAKETIEAYKKVIKNRNDKIASNNDKIKGYDISKVSDAKESEYDKNLLFLALGLTALALVLGIVAICVGGTCLWLLLIAIPGFLGCLIWAIARGMFLKYNSSYYKSRLSENNSEIAKIKADIAKQKKDIAVCADLLNELTKEYPGE